MLRILFSIDSLIRGGTELQLIDFIENLDRRSFEPYLLTIRPCEENLRVSNCKHWKWNVPKLLSPSGIETLHTLIKYMREYQFSVVHTFFQDSTLLSGLASYIARVPIRLASFRDLGFWCTKKKVYVLKQVYRTMNGYICNSEIVRTHCIEQFKLNPYRTYVIKNGFQVEKWPWIEQNGPTLHIGIVGNLNRSVKRTDLFLKAAGIVAKEYPHIRWHVIGDGPLRKKYEIMALTEGIKEKVFFTGRIKNVSDYLGNLQVGIICSDSEGLSNALIEYMSKGVACIATAVGGNSEIIENGKTGLLVPPGDVQKLADCIMLLIKDTKLRRNLSNSARNFVSSTFSWQRTIYEHERIYLNNFN